MRLIVASVILSLLSLNPAFPQSQADQDVTEAKALFKELGLRETPIPDWQKPDSVAILVPPSAFNHRPDLESWLGQVVGDVDVRFIPFREIGSAHRFLAQTDAIFGWCMPDVIKAAKNLRYLHNYGAGLDQCSFDKEVLDKNLLVTNGQGAAGPTMAEHVMGMMLTLSRNLHLYRDKQDANSWRRTQSPKTIALQDKTVLILGLGGIGREVAKRADAFGMRVIATRNSSRKGPDYVAIVGLASETLDLAAEADFVVNTLPLTSSTRGLIDKNFFKTMPPGGYYVSVGRGGTTVTTDLMAALAEGVLSGAALDVTDPEPLPQGHPLWNLPNVIITPHTSGSSDQSNKHRWMVVRENLRRYVRGQDLINVVDLRRGY